MDKTTPEETVQIGPRIPKSLKKEIDIICVREGTDLQDLVEKVLADYAKKHGNGNPAYALTEWIDCPTMKAYPNFKRDPKDWQEYIEQFDEKTETGMQILDEIETQGHIIKTFASNKKQYGTTNVRRY